MLKVTSLLIIVFGLSLQISAQCSVNFKESKRQVFSHSFSEGHFEDFDGDGLKDLLGFSLTHFENPGPDDYQLRYYKRLNANSFDTNAKSTTINNVNVTASFGIVGDVNGDGKKDLIVKQNTSPETFVTYLNDGTGSFSATTPTTNTDTQGEHLWVSTDLNNDGKDDIVSGIGANDRNTMLSYRLAQPDNTFGSPVTIASNVWIERAKGLFSIQGYYNFVQTYPLVVEDLNGDGLKDIAYVDNGTGFGPGLMVLTNTGNLSFTSTGPTQFAEIYNRLETYDFNNDGKKDFISSVNGSASRIAINNGNNTYTSSFLVPPDNSDNRYGLHYVTKDQLVTDIDNDGDQDVIFTGLRYHALYKNQGNGTFVFEKLNTPHRISEVADINNDGKGDLISLLTPLLNGYYELPDGSNTKRFQLHNSVSFKTNVCNPVGQTKIIDFNGDGTTDIGFWNPNNGVWRYKLGGFFSGANSNPEITFLWGSGALGDIPTPNDYDGDGKTDFAVFRKSNGTWWVRKSSDGSNFAIQFGISEDKPVQADYDGDGKADFAVYRPSTGQWHFWMSETNQYQVVQFGLSEDKPIPSDYDGDGKADISVFRPSTGVWYRYNSSDNSVFIVKYGIETDELIPGDYEGDGKSNIAVFRNGTNYVLKNDLSTQVFHWGIAGDKTFFNDGVVSLFGVYRFSETRTYYFSGTRKDNLLSESNLGGSSNEKFISSIVPSE